MKRFWFFFTFVIIFSGVLFLFLILKDSFSAEVKIKPEVSSIHKNVIQSKEAVSVGPKNAKVTVVQFFDFQCGYSKQAAPVVRELLDAYRNKSVRFEFRHLPLAQIHKIAFPAAQAALCANEQGKDKFLQMYSLIFYNQERLSEPILASIARQIQLNLSQYNLCLAQGKYRANILKDLKDSDTLNIEGTPTFFINSIPVVGAYSKEVYSEIIDNQLNKE